LISENKELENIELMSPQTKYIPTGDLYDLQNIEKIEEIHLKMCNKYSFIEYYLKPEKLLFVNKDNMNDNIDILKIHKYKLNEIHYKLLKYIEEHYCNVEEDVVIDTEHKGYKNSLYLFFGTVIESIENIYENCKYTYDVKICFTRGRNMDPNPLICVDLL
jgi:hypothetical protein